VSDTSIRTGGDATSDRAVRRKNYNPLIGEPTAELIKIQIAPPRRWAKSAKWKSGATVSRFLRSCESTRATPEVVEPIQQIVDAAPLPEITPPELVRTLWMGIDDRWRSVIRGPTLLRRDGPADSSRRGSHDPRRPRDRAHPRRSGEIGNVLTT
jgi:actin-like ATPase involved in cell morphogenesis